MNYWTHSYAVRQMYYAPVSHTRTSPLSLNQESYYSFLVPLRVRGWDGYLPSLKASPTIGWYRIILLGDRGICVLTTCPGLHSTAGQQDASPSCKPSLSIGWYQIILLGDRGICILTTCPGLHSTTGQQAASPAAYCYASKPRPRYECTQTSCSPVRNHHW